MSKDLGELIVKLGADIGELKSGLNTARSELASFKEQATSFGETVKKALAFAGVAVGLWEIAGVLKEFAKNAAMTGARTESLGIAMNKVGENAGMSAASLNYYVNELKKAGITTQESMSAIVTAMVSGIDLTQLQALATRARDVAVLAGKNTSETLQTIMHALVSRQMEVIRNLNVPMANYEDAVKKISRSLNIDKDQIDSVTLANALLKEFMESSKGAAGAAEAADKSVDKQMKSLARYAEEAKNSLWAFFEPIMQAGVQALASYWKDMEKWAKDNEAALRNLGTTIGEVIRKKLEMVGAVLKWVAANAELLAGLLKLYAIAKIAGYITAIGSACVGAAAQVGILTGSLTALQALISGPWKLIITVAVFGLYEAYQGILAVQSAARINAAKSGAIDTRTGKPEGLGMVTPIGGGTSKEEIYAKPKPLTDAEAKEFYQVAPDMAPGAGAKDKAVASAEQAAKEAEAAMKKAQDRAKGNMAPPKGGGKGGGGGKQPKIEDYTRLIEKELKAQLDLEEAKLDQSVKLLEAQQDKKKALLKREFDEGKMDGATYYAALEAMENEHHQSSLALIDQKIAAEKRLYPAQIQAVQDSPKLSAEAKAYEIEAMRLEHEARLAKLQGERSVKGTEHERKLNDLLREQSEWREKILEQMAQTNEDNTLGPIAQKEAEVNRYLRERAKLRNEIPADLQGDFDKATEAGAWKRTAGEEIEGWASTVANGFRNLFNSISEGTANLKQAINGFFKSLFEQSLEKGFQYLTQWLTDAIGQMFKSMGSGFASAMLGVIGIIGMLLTSGGNDKSTWSASGASTGMQNTNTALRGVIAGETSIPIAQIGESLKDALLPSEHYLSLIARNTGVMAGGMSVAVDLSGMAGAIRSALNEYFRQELVMGAR